MKLLSRFEIGQLKQLYESAQSNDRAKGCLREELKSLEWPENLSRFELAEYYFANEKNYKN